MSTSRSFHAALVAGHLYQCDFGEGALCSPVSQRPVQLPYGQKIAWADSPEEAATALRYWFPCSDRLPVEVRRYLNHDLLDGAPVHIDAWGGFPGSPDARISGQESGAR